MLELKNSKKIMKLFLNKERPLKAGKNPGKTRFNFKKVNKFELLDNQPTRIKIVYKNPKMNDWVKNKLSFYLSLDS